MSVMKEKQPELKAGSVLWLQLLVWSTVQQQHRESQMKHRVRDPGFTPTPAQPYPVPATHGSSLGALSKGCSQASSKVTLTLVGDNGKGGPGHCICLSPLPSGAEGSRCVLMEQEQPTALAVSPWGGGTHSRGWGGKVTIETSQGQQGQNRQERSPGARCGTWL